MTTHLYIPDVQVKSTDSFEFLTWIGKYIVDHKPDVIIQGGDFADMESLSSYDVGKKSYEGKRYVKDIQAAKSAMDCLLSPLREYNAKAKKNKEKQYKPRLVLTLGNHEQRISRAIENDPKLDGLISYKDLPYDDWEVHEFLHPVNIDGVFYCHYFPTGVLGRPPTSASAMVTKLHASCVAGHQQGKQIAYGKKPDGSTITCIIAGSCLTPDHKVLTADLKYVELGTISVGQQLVSFDEEVVDKRSRRYSTGTVTAIKRSVKPVYAVALKSGKVFKTTADHRWLVKTGSTYNWRTTDSLRSGTKIPKLFDEWEHNLSYWSGWLSGIYDGEGSLYQRKTTGGTVMQLAVSQKKGLVYDNIVSVLDSFGFPNNNSCAVGRDTHQIRLCGGTTTIAKFLGMFRPLRLISKFKPESLGRINSPDDNNDSVVSVKYLGDMEVVEIEIDKKTMIVEGYPHHNCYEHDEGYMDHLSNKHWRGVVMLYEVNNGSFDEAFISLNYLRKKYGNKNLS